LQAQVRSKLTRNVVSKQVTPPGECVVGHPPAIGLENSSTPGAISGCAYADVFRFENFPARAAQMPARFSSWTK
jgi:hypothetical protein